MNYTKNMRGFILLLVIIVSAASSHGQTPTPGKKQEKSIIYINATVHIGDGTKVLKGAVGFDNGLISVIYSRYKKTALPFSSLEVVK